LNEQVIAIIPARFGSTRFPGKPLAPIAGKAMILHVVERVRRARNVSRVLVATDDERILDAVMLGGAEAVMTRSTHSTGTDRLAEVATREIAPLYVNVQGDEPLIEPAAIDAAIDLVRGTYPVQVATLAVRIRKPRHILDPNIVKVVLDAEDNALYFSRAPIPFYRGDVTAPLPSTTLHRKHLGLYVYRREALLRFPELTPGRLERLEQLEQLRFLENGVPIRVGETQFDSVSVDEPAHVAKVEKILAGREKVEDVE
jgi:3-deoxy-manno-octulosonate cytidylyltransferase (CMP-KDO synthetase)